MSSQQAPAERSGQWKLVFIERRLCRVLYQARDSHFILLITIRTGHRSPDLTREDAEAEGDP